MSNGLSLAPRPELALKVTDLRTEIRLPGATVHAVDGVSLELGPGECLGLVGESGCGKTMTARSIMRLLPPGGVITGGSVVLAGTELTELSERDMQTVRGRDIGMVFQDPSSCLDPTMTIGRQISESAVVHAGANREAAAARAIELLGMVAMPEPERTAALYPHQLSGGMRQRAMIAAALACGPRLLIADEPTTALDVTIQAQILDLMRDLKTRVGTAILLITHDLSVIAEVADRVCVMYAGVIIEKGPVHEVFRRPLHPYAQGLLASIPRLDQPDKQLTSIPGSVPDLIHPPTGCRFHPRCPYAMPVCKEQRPPMTVEGPGHTVACYLYRGPVAAD